MRRLLHVAALAAALAFAGPASAQYTFMSPDQQPPPLRLEGWRNVLRVNVGAGFYNSDWYVCSYGWSCTTTSYSSFIPFLVGPQIDIHLGGPSAVSLGFNFGFGTIKQTSFDGTQDVDRASQITTYEPTLDYLVRLGSPTDETVGRLRIGGGCSWARRPSSASSAASGSAWPSSPPAASASASTWCSRAGR